MKTGIGSRNRTTVRNICLLIFSSVGLLHNLYALYFIGSAFLNLNYYECAVSPLLLVISFAWNELNHIYRNA